MSEEVKAKRSNAGKIRPSLFSPVALIACARVGESGALKYDLNNWRAGDGLDVLELIDSLGRHLLKFLVGIDKDDESGLPNIDHVLWNAMALSEQFHMGKMKRDGRYIDPKMAEAMLRIFSEWKEQMKEVKKND